MKIINSSKTAEDSWLPPKGKFGNHSKDLSIALGRKPESTDLNQRHPFDVSICRIPAGKTNWPFHSHSAQWEFYHVISGSGQVRDENETSDIKEGDAFIFKPGEAHQITNNGINDLVLYLVADNPIGDSCYYPDSKKWMVWSPERRVIRSEPLAYLDGEI